MLKTTILNNWRSNIFGNLKTISDLDGTGYQAWTIKTGDYYGVAIPYCGEEEINENFAGAKVRSAVLSIGDEPRRVLMLTSRHEDIAELFAALCEDFVDPGKNGGHRLNIENSPVSWWMEWKELLGNRSSDNAVYDVLGELCTLLYAVKSGETAKWNGPEGASCDIETDERFMEVKSSISKFKKQATISNQFQLAPSGKPTNLIFCVFEPASETGICIDGVLDELKKAGYGSNELDRELESLGFEKGMSSRRKKFILQEMLMYTVDESFPHISPDSFVGGTLPNGVLKINYTVDLSSLTPVSLLKEGANGQDI